VLSFVDQQFNSGLEEMRKIVMLKLKLSSRGPKYNSIVWLCNLK
jgi:hypothetical protein